MTAGLAALAQGVGVAPDSLRRVLGEVFARPEYCWVGGRQPLEWLFELWQRLEAWLDGLEQAHPAGFKPLLAALVLVLIGLFTHIGYVVWRIVRPTGRTPARSADAARTRLEDARAHRERAEALAHAGRYAEALAHRFLAAVLELERRQALAFHPSKTPAEYVSEARLDAAGRASLASLVARLYRHLFGAVPCDEPAYREFAAAADLLGTHVASA